MTNEQTVAAQSKALQGMVAERNEKKASGLNTILEEQEILALANVYLVNAGATGNAARLRREIGDERFFEVEAW